MIRHSLNTVADEIHAIAVEHGFNELTPEGWDDPWIVPGKIALIHSEASEALESFRKEQDDKTHFTEELADIIIRTLDLAASLKLDIDTAVYEKIEANRRRPFKHGGKRI